MQGGGGSRLPRPTHQLARHRGGSAPTSAQAKTVHLRQLGGQEPHHLVRCPPVQTRLCPASGSDTAERIPSVWGTTSRVRRPNAAAAPLIRPRAQRLEVGPLRTRLRAPSPVGCTAGGGVALRDSTPTAPMPRPPVRCGVLVRFLPQRGGSRSRQTLLTLQLASKSRNHVGAQARERVKVQFPPTLRRGRAHRSRMTARQTRSWAQSHREAERSREGARA